jgi:threonine dehydratase
MNPKSNAPTIEDIRKTAEKIAPYIIRTPTVPCYGPELSERFGENSDVFLKLELLQRSGSFKARGALNNAMSLSKEELANGLTAFSAGNHAIATSFAAKVVGTSAKVAMPSFANPYRVERCKALGAEIVFAENMMELFDIGERLQREEGRALVHPFESPRTFEGTATVGLEICEDIEDLDAVIVPIGGGGLISGITSAVKQLQPDCQVFGVEPSGAMGMSISLKQGAPLAKVELSSIADSLSAPMHLPLSFSIIQEFVDEVVTVEDSEIIDAMRLMFSDLKLAVEPAGASAIAARLGPLKEKLAGKRVALVICGSNIDMQTHAKLVAQ